MWERLKWKSDGYTGMSESNLDKIFARVNEMNPVTVFLFVESNHTAVDTVKFFRLIQPNMYSYKQKDTI